MTIAVQGHVLESLTDGSLESRPPSLDALASTWSLDLIGHEEPTGQWNELVDHARDMAQGLCDAASGFMSYAEKQDERSDEDAMRIAVQGGVRTYEQEQGFAPLVLEPRLMRDGSPNADALMAAWLDEQSPSTSLTTPDMPNRRHWGDVDLGEQMQGVDPLDAEQPIVEERDPLIWMASQLAREGGISPSYGLDGVTFEDLEQGMGGQGAANYFAHLVSMQEHQLDALQRELDDARIATALHPVPYWRQVQYIDRKPVGIRKHEQRYERARKSWQKVYAPNRTDWTARVVEPAPEFGLKDIPTDPRWLRKYGSLIRSRLAEWYPDCKPGSAQWKHAAKRVYFHLSNPVQRKLPDLGPLPDVAVPRTPGNGIGRLPKLPPSPCRCQAHEPCPIHRAGLPGPSMLERLRERNADGLASLGWVPIRVEYRTPEQALTERLLRAQARDTSDVWLSDDDEDFATWMFGGADEYDGPAFN